MLVNKVTKVRIIGFIFHLFHSYDCNNGLSATNCTTVIPLLIVDDTYTYATTLSFSVVDVLSDY